MIHMNRHLLQQALDMATTGVMIVDTRGGPGKIVYVNEAMSRLAGRHPDLLIGREWTEFAATAAGTRQRPLDPAVAPAALSLRWGQERSTSVTATPLYDRPGRAGYWMLSGGSPESLPALSVPGEDAPTGTFVLDLRLRGARDERLDPVTGLPGRRMFLEMLSRDWGSAQRAHRRVSLIVFRVDAVEAYQEVFGRHATDACLRKVAHAIANLVRRSSDYCGRLDAERFAVMVADSEESEVRDFAARIAQRVRDLAIHHPRAPQQARFVTLSCGVSSAVPGPGITDDILLNQAENAVGPGLVVDPSSSAGNS